MAKVIIKETIITILLCVAILLILSVLFYDYNPMSKVVPSKQAYTTPETIKDELEEMVEEEKLTIENKVYTIEGSDLNIYKQSKSYVPGKANPFAAANSDLNETATNTTSTDKTTSNKTGTSTDKTENKNDSKTTENNKTDDKQESTNTTFWDSTGSK